MPPAKHAPAAPQFTLFSHTPGNVYSTKCCGAYKANAVIEKRERNDDLAVVAESPGVSGAPAHRGRNKGKVGEGHDLAREVDAQAAVPAPWAGGPSSVCWVAPGLQQPTNAGAAAEASKPMRKAGAAVHAAVHPPPAGVNAQQIILNLWTIKQRQCMKTCINGRPVATCMPHLFLEIPDATDVCLLLEDLDGHAGT